MWWVLDVHYGETSSRVGGVGVLDLLAAEGVEAVLEIAGAPAPYAAGSFYLRELPLLLAFLEGREACGVVVDGFVWLGSDRAGLGKHLHDVTGLPVIGVAKNGFHEAATVARAVQRGGSTRSLWVTSEGVDGAAEVVRAMHGPWRVPTLLKRADRLSRDGLPG